MQNNNNMKYRKLSTKVNMFPLNLNNHMITFTFENYHRESVQKPAEASIEQTLALPMPSNLTEQVSLSWSDGDSWSVLADDAAAILAGGQSRNEILTKHGERFKNAMSSIKGFKEEVSEKAGQTLESLKLRIPGVGEALSSFTGTAINPNIAVVFKGQAGTREHTFNWKLVPENPEESVRLRDIIREFRWQALPNKQSAYLLDYPNQCKIQLFGSELGYLPFYKTCVITNVEVNYTPEGIPTFMRETGAPAAVSISITFKETTQLFKNDIATFDPQAKDNKLLNFNETANRNETMAEKKEKDN